MKASAIESFVIGLLKTAAAPGAKHSIRPEAELMIDLEIDSIAMLSMIFSIDEKYGIGEALGADIAKIRTVGDLVNAVEKLVEQKTSERVIR